MSRSGAVPLVVVIALVLSGPGVARSAHGAPAAPNGSAAESLYVKGDLAGAEAAYTLLQPAKDDTLIHLRVASLQLLRNDRAGARATLAPVLARKVVPRSALAILAESYARDLDFGRAAPVEGELGRAAIEKQMESFAGTAPYRYEGPERVRVPFVQTDPLPLIEVRINGRGPYLFLIDTGGGDLVVDPVLADSLGSPRFGEIEGTFGGGRKKPVTMSRIASLGLGDATLHDLPASLLDCSRFSGIAGGRRIWGIVGTIVLMQSRATLDYPGGALILERRVAARKTAAVPADSNRHVLPMWLGGDHYVVTRGRLGSGPEALWFVDTGLAGAGVTVPPSTLQAAGIAVPDTSTGSTGVGGGGAMKYQMFPVEDFRLGPASSGRLIGIFGAFPPTLEHAFGYRIAGIISHAFFRSWRVTFDFDAMQLVLEKPESTTAK